MAEETSDAPSSAGADGPPPPQSGLSTEVLWSALKAVGLGASALDGGKEAQEPELGPAAVLLQASPPGPARSAADAVPAAQPAPASGTTSSGGHTPESIARLPPKLRARLLQRGILREADVRAAESREGGSAAAGPGQASPGTPPEGPTPGQKASPGTPPEVPVPFRKAPPSRPPAAAVPFPAATPAAVAAAAAVAADSLPVPASLSKAGAALLGAAVSKAKAVPVRRPVQRSVYASAPMLNPEAMQQRVAEEALEAAGGSATAEAAIVEASEDREAKRRRQQEGLGPGAAAVASPAALRAAEARARGDTAPTWTFAEHEVAEGGVAGRLVPAAPAAAAPAAVAAVAPAAAASAASSAAATGLPAAAAAAAPAAALAPPAEPAQSEGPALPAGWIRVPHDGDFYYWNTATDEVSWEHPAGPKAKPEKPVFREEHKVLWTDLGKIIGRQGLNLKIMKASLGCTVKVPRQGGKGKGGKGEGGKGEGKDSKGKAASRGIGTGETPLTDDQFATVVITGETKHMAMAGKRTIEIMLGYGRNVERALAALGVEAKMPSTEELAEGGGSGRSKDGLDPMDPAAYSDAPVGGWSAGMPKPDARGGGGRSTRGGPEPRDAKSANAERF